jgi:hypothetical protein
MPKLVARHKITGEYLRSRQSQVGRYTTDQISVAFQRSDRVLVERKLQEAAPYLHVARLNVADFEIVEAPKAAS